MRYLFLLMAGSLVGSGFAFLRADADSSVATADFTNAVILGLDPTGQADGTPRLQAALDAGKTRIFFPEGTYLLGTVNVPGKARLVFGDDTAVSINPALIQDKVLFRVAGNNVAIQNLKLVFPKVGDHEMGPAELDALIKGDNITNLTVDGLKALRTQGNYQQLCGIVLGGCSDISVTRCEISNLYGLVMTFYTQRVAVRNNKATHCDHITLFRDGSEWLTHEGNWSSQVGHQCEWWGGDADTQKPSLSMSTVDVMNRGTSPQTPGFVPNTPGAYDIQVLGNYAEYGVTLAWGSKGRDILISNNVARYMGDMCYDAEGCENVVISNNVAIDARFFGIGCYFWGNSVLIANNLIVVNSEGDPTYQGDFIRLQSPANPAFGSGKVLITGNLCIGKKDRIRLVNLERSRDVTISGNKFMNGRINVTSEAQDVSILNNEITEDLPGNYSAITGASGNSLYIRNNIIRRKENEQAPVVGAAAAISNFVTAGGKRAVEGNLIDGWKFSAWSGTVSSTGIPGIFRNNTISGELLEDKDGRLFDQGNILLSNPTLVTFRVASAAEAATPKP